ncbi:MAG: hypothetical protein VW455_07505 [Nitrospinota bacterium]
MPDKCPVCTFELNGTYPVSGTYDYSFDCPNCGKYILESLAESLLKPSLEEHPNQAGVISHYLRKNQKGKNWPTLDDEILKKLVEEEIYPNPAQQAANLILWLGKNISAPGEAHLIQPKTHQAIIGARDAEGIEFVLDYLFDKKLVENGRQFEMTRKMGVAFATLSFEGWAYYEAIMKGQTISKKAFMAMEFGNTVLDKVFSECFKPAVKKTGFDLQTVLEQPKAGSIDDRIRVEIRNSKFLIADLSHSNNGAYWEAGFAEGLGKIVIYTCQKSVWENEKTHFDTNHHQTIIWDENDLEKAAEDLKATIRASLPEDAIMSDE